MTQTLRSDKDIAFIKRFNSWYSKWLHEDEYEEADNLVLDLCEEIKDYFNIPEGN